MASPSFSSDQLEEVSSWVHNERHCVSIGAISRNTGLSRTQAQELLRKVPNATDSYQATKVVVSEEENDNVKTTVFKLVSAPISESSTLDDSLFSLCLCSNSSDDKQPYESLNSAHEREMAQLRDCIADNRIQHLVAENNADLITPAEQVLEQMKQTARPDAVIVQESGRSATKKKATSAASFFAKQETTTKSSSANRKQAAKSSVAKKPATNKFFQKKTETGKENRLAAKKKKVGNVDDFVGDSDSSNDDDSEMEPQEDDPMDIAEEPEEIQPEPRRKKVVRKAPVITKEELGFAAMEEEPVQDDDSSVHGAMDSFASAAQTKRAAAAPHRRRRKKLVEKTTTDENGYLHTSTQEVWEDIASDDEAEKTIARPAVTKTEPAKKKKASGTLKQGTIMGFFVKK